LEDERPLVRYEAVRGISALLARTADGKEQEQKLASLWPLLTDKIRAVRTEAARVLTEVPADLFNEEQRGVFEKALDEFKERQYAALERPESHLNLAVIYQNMGRTEEAEASYKTSIRMDRFFTPARFNLANLYNSLGRNEEAEEIFREIIEVVPNNGEAYYSLGLLLAEMKRLDDAVKPLKRASELMPERARVRYNYALVLQNSGRLSEAESEMLSAYRADMNDPSIVHALTVFYAQHGRWDKALPFAQKLVELLPGAPEALELLKQIERKMPARK
jgi:tetratricopeptide (TPR) repeat protein